MVHFLKILIGPLKKLRDELKFVSPLTIAMDYESGNLSSPLLSPLTVPGYFGIAVMMIVILFSAVGMLFLKSAEVYHSVFYLCAGYVFEFVAFFLYPLALHYIPMRIVVVCWSAASNVTAYIGGMLLFGDAHSSKAMVGCALNVLGVALVATS